MRLASFVRTAAYAGVVCACSNSTGPDDALNVARKRWLQQAPAEYRMVLFRSCECTPEMAGPVAVFVRNGTVQSREYTASGAAVPLQFANNFPGVDGLFAIIADAHRRDAYRVEVTYDARLGYPTLIAIDYDRIIADDEFSYTATDFRPLGSGG